MLKNESLIILAAGKPHQGDKPSLLATVNGCSLFDWQINALTGADCRPQVVLGYASEQLAALSSQAQLHTNSEWQTTGSGYSLLSADLSQESVIVSYADILYRPSLVAQLQQSASEITIVYDSLWKQRFIGRTQGDLEASEKVILSGAFALRAGQDIPVEWAQGEFIGLVRFQGKALELLRSLQKTPDQRLKLLSLSGLVEWLRLQDLAVSAIDVHGDWAELNAAQDIAHFILGTKAETLARLNGMLRKAIIQDQVAFTVAQWQDNADEVLTKIQTTFKGLHLVVRSSARSEDAFTHSNAGSYTSLLNVYPDATLHSAIEEVIESYTDSQPEDQVLVQPMVQDVLLSGVAFTRTLEQGAPFYVINYDESGDTESITSGNATQHKSLYLRKDADEALINEEHLRPLICAIKEVEQVLNYDALDIEFALDKTGQVHLLQVRPIVITGRDINQSDQEKVVCMQQAACLSWQELQVSSPHLIGEKALFGIMPDWNPAEIIGTNPGQLAVSLYKYLILDEVWATQRAEYGYKDVRPQPLLRQFAGKPYIDIRASFNSFVPKDLSIELTKKLVNFYLGWLESHPHLHDKVEFDVVPTCFGPGFSFWERRLKDEAGLSEQEISELKQGLLQITQNAISRTAADLNSLDILLARHKQVLKETELSKTEKISILLENSKRYGTLPFAHLARSGFVAVTLLKEAVGQGWLSERAKNGFLETVETISHELSEDAWQTSQGNKSWESFVETYGHLRPGTYDITSPVYADDPERFLRPLIKQAQAPKSNSENTNLWQTEKTTFFNKLQQTGIQATSSEIEQFLIRAIEGREKAKFIFTNSLSAALGLLAEIGKDYDLSLEELSNMTLYQLQEAFESGQSVEIISQRLKDIACQNKAERQISHACQLPPLLCSANDFSAFILTEGQPNYIGSKRITAKIVHLDDAKTVTSNVEECIVLIPQADPGYDWLFGQKIAGLITMYGGANSHMAIRTAEFGLSAAIGVGEQLYRSLNKAQTLEIDPSGGTIRVIH